MFFFNYPYKCFVFYGASFCPHTGTKVEGILRQSADVEEVERRVYEYEQGIDIVTF